MYPGWDPEWALREVLRRQEEVRERARAEAEARRVVQSTRKWSLAAFGFWRVHVIVWLERAPRT